MNGMLAMLYTIIRYPVYSLDFRVPFTSSTSFFCTKEKQLTCWVIMVNKKLLRVCFMILGFPSLSGKHVGMKD